MSHVYIDNCSRQFPEDTPFVLQTTPAAQRWTDTIHRVNELVKSGRMNPLVAILLIIAPVSIGIALELYLIINYNDTSSGLMCLFAGIFVMFIGLGISIAKARRSARNIHEFLRQENSTYYNNLGINLVFINTGNEHERTRIEIEVRAQPQMVQPVYNPQQTYPNQFAGYAQVPSEQQMMGQTYTGGQPIYAAPQYAPITK
eukprot:TRINITY_DN1104_c0_g1_i1.p1 TRINITY_DN1104_c0_g1~~TRINITY_DN1104_c0_g1_i1.p1  ORF type:complete len:201 (-),score=46.65 TRINITY_DN1104_c0_g1_i1:79-681(-)